MADYNLKSITTDTDGPSADTELLFGAPDQSAGTPKPYSFAGIKTWIKSWSDALYLDAASNLSDLASPTTARDNLVLGFGHMKTRYYAFTDCEGFGAGFNGTGFCVNASGTGASTSAVDYGSTNAIGVLSLDMGTTTTGRAAIITGSGVTSTLSKFITFGRGRVRFRAKMAIHVLSNATEQYRTRIGFIDSMSFPSNGLWFSYIETSNSGKWLANSTDNTAASSADTGVTAAADVYQEFTIDVNAAGTSAAFYIDNVLVATITTNIPTTAGRSCAACINAVKGAGTTATSGGYVDYVEVQQDLTTAR